ncbi:MAG: hypothetical protein ACYCW6_24045 [Candidatus Xenobia bacterium]
MIISPYMGANQSSPLGGMSPLGGGMLPGMGGNPLWMLEEMMMMMLVNMLMQLMMGNLMQAEQQAQQQGLGGMPGGGGPMGGGGACPAPYGGGGSPYGGGGSPYGGSPYGGGGSPYGAALPPAQYGPPGTGNQASVDLARRYLGQNSINVRGQLPGFTAAGGQTNDCADFVSSVLQDTQGLKGHHVNVHDLEQSLIAQGWHRVSGAQARPGDVWMNSSRGHTQLVATPGATRTIGSNNDRPGHQRISERNNNPNTGIYYTRG